jgi:hypothetical protein
MKSIKYYFILASDNFLFRQEPLEEILRERVQNYNKKKKLLNFWIIKNPEFIKYLEDINVPENCVAVVSTEKTFITWLKLRLNNVMIGNFSISKKSHISPLKSI